MSRTTQYTPITPPVTLGSLQNEIIRLRQEMEARIRQAREEQAAIDRQRMFEELERQRIELEKRIAQLNGTNDGLKREMLSRLKEQQEDFRKEIQAQDRSTGKSIAEVKKSIDKVDKKLSGRIDKVDTKVDNLGKSVDAIIQKFKKEERQASEMAAEASRILKEVMARTPVERYTPVMLKKIVTDIQAVEGSKLPAASNIAVIHQIIRDIVHMEEEANRLRLAHEALLTSARSQASSLSGFHKSHENVEVDAGKGKKVKVAADFWTRGKYGGIGADVADIARQLETDRDTKGVFLTDEDVVRLGDELERLQADTVSAIADTSRLATESQIRFKMARNIVEASIKDGWTVVKENGEDAFDFLGSEGQEKDMREGFFAILKKGNELLTVTIVEKDGKPHLVIHNTFDGGNPPTRQHLDGRRIELGRRLEAMGFPAGTLSEGSRCVSDDPIPGMSSAKALQGKGGAKTVRAGIENGK